MAAVMLIYLPDANQHAAVIDVTWEEDHGAVNPAPPTVVMTMWDLSMVAPDAALQAKVESSHARSHTYPHAPTRTHAPTCSHTHPRTHAPTHTHTHAPTPTCLPAGCDKANWRRMVQHGAAWCRLPNAHTCHAVFSHLRKERSDPTTPAGSRHSCQPAVKLDILPLVWNFPLWKG